MNMRKDFIKGGLADLSSENEFDPFQLKKGIEVEMEHTKDIKIAKEIAMDHLKEDPFYYDKLNKVNLQEHFNNWRKHLNKLTESLCRIPTIDNQRSREEMPQIKPELIQSFLIYLREQGIEFFKTRVKVSELVGSQSSVDCEKIKELVNQGFEKLSNGVPIFIARDNVIADGHTRTMALRLIDPNADIACWEINADIEHLLKMMKLFQQQNENRVDI